MEKTLELTSNDSPRTMLRQPLKSLEEDVLVDVRGNHFIQKYALIVLAKVDPTAITNQMRVCANFINDTGVIINLKQSGDSCLTSDENFKLFELCNTTVDVDNGPAFQMRDSVVSTSLEIKPSNSISTGGQGKLENQVLLRTQPMGGSVSSYISASMDTSDCVNNGQTKSSAGVLSHNEKAPLSDTDDAYDALSHDDRNYKCNWCPKYFLRKTALSSHENVCSKKPPESDSDESAEVQFERVHQCNECMLIFTNDVELDHHVREVHGHQTSIGHSAHDLPATRVQVQLGERCDSKQSQKSSLKERVQENRNLVERLYESNKTFKEESSDSTCINIDSTRSDMIKAETLEKGPLDFSQQDKRCSAENTVRMLIEVGAQQISEPSVETVPTCRSNLYKCSNCQKQFVRPKSFIKHESRCHEKSHKCHKCGKCFSISRSLDRHLACHSRHKPYKCDTCGRSFVSTFAYNRHLRTHEENAQYKCSKCDQQFNNKRKLIQHSRQHLANNEVYRCEFCGAQFLTATAFKIHARTEHSQSKPFVCKTCGKRLMTPNILKCHMRTHGERRFFCRFCKKGFFFQGTLDIHERTHTNERPYVCDICGQACRELGALKRHMQIHTGEKSFICDQCGRAFLRSRGLESHRITHTQDYTYFPCSTCGKQLTSKSSLNAHVKRVHHALKEIKCPNCGKEFFDNSGLRRHILSKHTANREKPFLCNECGKSFLRRSSLNSHSSVHTGLRPHECITCGKTFPRKDHLKLHMRTHTGEKPFTCDVCGKSFTQKCTLTLHNKRHEQIS